jgi:soluble lytic murein transglycosylase-like protein
MQGRPQNMDTGWRRLWLPAVLGILVVGTALGSSAQALADRVAWVFEGSDAAVLSTPRDPSDFIRDLDVVLPRPVVVLSRQDAIARELLTYTRTMSATDALRVSQALCEEAEALGWDPLLFLAVIHVESYYDHLAVSPVGAEGLMQLMPYTAEWMAERVDLSWPDNHSFDPVLNVQLGARYLDRLGHEFARIDLILTAYNRGPRATRFITSRNGGRLPSDIRDFYATKVLDKYEKLRKAYGHLPVT